VRTLPEALYAPFSGMPNVKFTFDTTYDLLSAAQAAIVTSGTATLETALFRVPQAVIYKAGFLEMKLLKKLVKVKFISLPNLVADNLIIKEFIQEDASARNLIDELERLVSAGPYRNTMLENYEGLWKRLDTGSASQNAATLMIKYLKS
jgi:lipid-A-disaccharide synthase